MKKYFVLLSLPLMFSCKRGTKEKTTAEDSLTSVNQDTTSTLNEQQLVINSKETAITEFLKSFNEIQSNLNEIKEKEKMVNLNVKSSDLKKSDKDRIISDIQFIYDKMNKNKQNLYTVNKKLKEYASPERDAEVETEITKYYEIFENLLKYEGTKEKPEPVLYKSDGKFVDKTIANDRLFGDVRQDLEQFYQGFNAVYVRDNQVFPSGIKTKKGKLDGGVIKNNINRLSNFMID